MIVIVENPKSYLCKIFVSKMMFSLKTFYEITVIIIIIIGIGIEATEINNKISGKVSAISLL